MCVSCGCGAPNENHGDRRNITMQQIEEAAQAANISAEEVGENIQSSMDENMSSGVGQSQQMRQDQDRPTR